jgi:hypothetical protein
MALGNPPLRKALMRIRKLERRPQEKPCSGPRAAQDDWLRELFAGISDLRDVDVALLGPLWPLERYLRWGECVQLVQPTFRPSAVVSATGKRARYR